MANNFQRGDLCPVSFQPSGGAETTLSVKGWSGDNECLTFDVTSTGHGGVGTARLGGKRDRKGSCQLCFDLDAPPYATAPSITEGTSGVFKKYVSPTKFFTYPAIIKRVHFESAVESEVKWSVDWEENILAGTYAVPAT